MPKALTWRTVFAWYLIALALCIAGTYLAYSGPLSSDSWRQWGAQSGVYPPTYDALRAVFSAGLALFALYCLGVVSDAEDPSKRNIGTLTLSKNERWLVALVILLTVIFAFFFLPFRFQNNYWTLLQQHEVRPRVGDPLSFRQIWQPYWFPYSLYVCGLWLGMVAPVLFVLVRSIGWDWPQLRNQESQLRLDEGAPVNVQTVFGFRHSSTEYLESLKSTATRYIALFLIIITMMLLEQLTYLHCSVSEEASDWGKALLWLLLVPAFLISIVVFMFSYESGKKKSERGLNALIDRLRGTANSTDGLNEAQSALDDIRRNYNSAAALFAVLKTGTVGVFLLVIIVGALSNAFLKYHWYWAQAFFPTPFLNWVHSNIPLLPPPDLSSLSCPSPSPLPTPVPTHLPS